MIKIWQKSEIIEHYVQNIKLVAWSWVDTSNPVCGSHTSSYERPTFKISKGQKVFEGKNPFEKKIKKMIFFQQGGSLSADVLNKA